MQPSSSVTVAQVYCTLPPMQASPQNFEAKTFQWGLVPEPQVGSTILSWTLQVQSLRKVLQRIWPLLTRETTHLLHEKRGTSAVQRKGKLDLTVHGVCMAIKVVL